MRKRENKECSMCGNVYEPTGQNQVRCKPCGVIHTKEQSRLLHKETYVRKGYDQKGQKNNAWKNGTGAYRGMVQETACTRCGSEKHILVHHRDRDRANNTLSNLEVLCRRCHHAEHGCSKNLPSPKVVGKMRKKFLERTPQDVVRDKQGRFKVINHKV